MLESFGSILINQKMSIRMKICKKCNREPKRLKRGFCDACYEYGRIHGLFRIIERCNVENLTTIQSEHILGSLLGDGSIEMGKLAKHARLCISRQSKDKEYIEWQASVFNNLCVKDCIKHASVFDKRTEKYYLKSYFRTRNCPIITKYWIKWYPNNIKIVPRDIEFSPISLLIWFLDDGSVHYDNSKNCSTLRLDLFTMGFTLDDNLFLSQKLSEYLKEDVNVLMARGKCYLRLTNVASRKFISIIDPLFPNCMLRKAKWKNNDCDYYKVLK